MDSDIYVDDIVSGANSLSQATQLQNDLIQVLAEGGFELRKWASNNPYLLSNVPVTAQQLQPHAFGNDDDSVVKVLGLQWNPSTDTFFYVVKPLSHICTKRSILSELAKIFDPLGFLSPLTLFLKHLIQILWTLGLEWDSSPSEKIVDIWNQFRSQLACLSSVHIPRLIIPDIKLPCQLIGFCDASETGYSSVIYLRVVIDDNISVKFICSKTKVAPLKRISIPRLELCAALLLSKLMHFVQNIYSSKLNIQHIFAFTDSTIVLAWVRSSPHKWSTFVSNRVTIIQEKIPPAFWFHVLSQDNPADIASRGCLPNEFATNSLWWAGPAWLKVSQRDWPTAIPSYDYSQETEEERKTIVCSVEIVDNSIFALINKHSSFPKIQRIISYILRFVYNARHPNSRKTGTLTLFDFEEATKVLVKQTQLESFSKEIDFLKKKRNLPKFLRKLTPFLDNDGVLRVGGRLVYSKLSFENRHPALLPSDHRLTRLIIEYTHEKYLHASLAALHHLLIQKYWILAPKRTIRKVLAKCIRCFRVNPVSPQPPMGNLPTSRITQIKPFSKVGVDYGGPFSIKLGRIRGSKTQKAYICLFVCMATKAVHLELASDLSTDTFLGALRRFISRRGQCTHIYSDQGTNFSGAARQLSHNMRKVAEKEGIKWIFNPPLSPNFGGLWESGIKSVKGHLLRIVGEQILTYEEFYTILVQVEAVLNSRPLCPLSSDPNDYRCLTPGHFLTLFPLNSPVEPDLEHLPLNHLSRWQLVQRFHQHFWKRWHREYLHTLLQRAKWTDPSTSISLGTLVLLKDENAPPLKWHYGRIADIHPGADGITRVVSVKTNRGVFKRPVTKVCPLPI